MKKQISINGFLILCLIISALCAISTTAQEVEDEREFDYRKGSEKGPNHWGDLKEEWKACKKGELQSPIDLSIQRARIIPKAGEIQRRYNPSNATAHNRGHDISLQWDLGKAGYIMIDGTKYFLQQCHWHSPSEHSFNGKRYELEVHMVHINPVENAKNKIAVVGALYKIGKPDPLLSKLMKNVKSMIDEKGERSMGIIDPRSIKMRGKYYFRYMGSLTVPPCTEGVIWTINKKIGSISREQVNLLREAVHDYAEENARPLQPQNRREIHLYGHN